MSKKYYKDVYDPFEAEVEDIEGKIHNLKSIKLTLVALGEMEKIIEDHTIKSKTSDGIEVISYRDIAGMVNKQMVLFFGKDEKFYKQFSMDILNEILMDLKSDTASKKNE
jgi:hypothetical protein